MKAKIWILAVLAGAVLLGGCTGNTSDNDKKTESVSGKQESSGTNASSGKSDSLPLPVTF